MPRQLETGSLRINAQRAGLVREVVEFLSDLDRAYTALYALEFPLTNPRSKRRWLLPFDLEFESAYPFGPNSSVSEIQPTLILPEHRLTLTKVSIQSPGFWEFAASLNPLVQLREWFNDRHKRRQDTEFREAAEKQKLQLENELLQQQITRNNNVILRERLELWREMGHTDADIRQMIWSMLGPVMLPLAKHQDSGLIDNAEFLESD